MKQEVEVLKNQKPQTIPKVEIAPKASTKISSQTDTSYSSVVNKWKNEIAYIECNISDPTTGKALLAQSGSGYYMSDPTSNWYMVITNKHVAQFEVSGSYKYATDCSVQIPGDTQAVSVPHSDMSGSGNNEVDIMGLTIKNPSAYMIKKPMKIQTTCRTLSDGVNIGDKVLILGYPGIGSRSGITVTDGIISGIDFPYYVTSAKIEHGNSGGVAVLVKNNGCYLGIPTSAATGEIESLGRILDGAQALYELFY